MCCMSSSLSFIIVTIIVVAGCCFRSRWSEKTYTALLTEALAGSPVLHQQVVGEASGNQTGVPGDSGEGDRDDDPYRGGDQRCVVDALVGAVLVIQLAQVQRATANHVVVD